MRWIYLWATRAQSSKQTNKTRTSSSSLSDWKFGEITLYIRHYGIVLMPWCKRFSGMSSSASTWCAITWKSAGMMHLNLKSNLSFRNFHSVSDAEMCGKTLMWCVECWPYSDDVVQSCGMRFLYFWIDSLEFNYLLCCCIDGEIPTDGSNACGFILGRARSPVYISNSKIELYEQPGNRSLQI